jgi:hypothetical protein
MTETDFCPSGRRSVTTEKTEEDPVEHRTRHVVVVLAAAMAVLTTFAAAPAFAQGYTFTKVADSLRDDFDPNNFTCASINDRGDIAFRAGRTSADGLNSFDGIYRANADGTITTIAEDPRRKRFGFLGNFPSMNDLGQVSFAANLAPDSHRAILRGDGKKLVTIATTAKQFNFFGFGTSVNDRGEVAFKAELDPEFEFDEGLFSGSGGKLTTHYRASTAVSLDGELVRFGGNDSRPSINDAGDIAFDESVQRNFDGGIFVGQEGAFRTIAAPGTDGSRSVGEPTLNDDGTAAFETSFFDENEQFVTAIVTGSGGPLTTVADTTGPFGSFGFRPPSINDREEVAYLAFLDDFQTSGIFVGPEATADRVIATGDQLDGAIVSNLTFCEEGLSNTGELAFIATLDELDGSGFRTAVFRATPEG